MVRLAVSLGFLILLFLPAPPTSGRWPAFDLRLPIEALVIIGFVAAWALAERPVPRLIRWLLALGVLLTAAIHLIETEGLALMGRDIDLVSDLGHASSVVGLLSATASRFQIVSAAVAGIALPLLLLSVIAWAIGTVEHGLAGRKHAAVAILTATGAALMLAGGLVVSASTVAAVERQSGAAIDNWRASHGERGAFLARLGNPPRSDADLQLLAGRDVYVIFFESYGAVLLDDPALKARAAPALTQFGASLANAGFTLRSARIASPTYGGGSWLAHGTVDSGTWLNSQLRYDLLASTARPTWPRLMARAGYQTVDAMPGLKEPLASADFWGFEQMVGTDGLDYPGPQFGWFGVPDQYALGTIEHLPRAPERPLFMQIVLVSSHMPFAPVPPYVADWSDAGRFASHPEVATEVETPPDWQNLSAPYLASVAYDLKVLGDWIPRAVKGGALVIILGDHQPPALIGAASASHDVPIHVLSRDPEIVRRVAGEGFTDGAFPIASVGSMSDLLPHFLDAVSTPREKQAHS
jgi:hypothetical protein